MKRIRVITCVLTAMLVTAAFTGCSETEVKTADTSKQQEQGQQVSQNERGSMAKVVSLDGDQLTVILADMRGGNRGDRVPPADSAPPENAENPQTAASGAAIDDSSEPGGPGQPGQPRQGGGEIEFTGEEATYTLSGDVTITKGIGDSATEIDLSELAVDDVIHFTTATGDDGNEEIQSIVVME